MSSSALVIDEEPISLRQTLNYLQFAGRLQSFLLDILNQHAISQKLQRHPELILRTNIVDELIVTYQDNSWTLNLG